MNGDMVNLKQATQLSGVQRRTIYNWLYAGWIRTQGQKHDRRVSLSDIITRRDKVFKSGGAIRFFKSGV